MKHLETLTTPCVNTIPVGQQPEYPGDWALEKKIKSIIRWNAMAMVVQANHEHSDLGRHISTFASVATLFEVGFNHFFRARNEHQDGDLVFFQRHASPGVYARAFLEGRLTEEQLHNFRQECGGKAGLSSYPHPWLMPDFWEVPTVSMGLGPIMAIYQARFNRYLEHRQIKDTSESRVWCFLGDGECDEPEALGALSVAGREQLDTLIFVVSCNLQRLDGPVRGNGKIIQELEAVFRGAGWNVIKLIWGRDWDPLLEADRNGLLLRRMEEAVDGDYQMYSVASGGNIREHFFGKYGKKLLGLVATLRDHPRFNASIDVERGEILLHKHYNIGVAVDTEHGLLVPVLHHAERRSVRQLAGALEQLVERAQRRKLTREDLRGATFSISNQGGLGGTAFTPIIHPPEVAILGVSRTRQEQRPDRSERLILPLSLSYDHRRAPGPRQPPASRRTLRHPHQLHPHLCRRPRRHQPGQLRPAARRLLAASDHPDLQPGSLWHRPRAETRDRGATRPRLRGDGLLGRWRWRTTASPLLEVQQ